MTEATDHHTEIGSDRDARLASWACICGKSEVIHFARAAGEPVALRLMRIKADLHKRGETETERLMRIKADLHERGETETDMRDPNEALLIAVREAVTEARRAGATEMACLWDAAVAAVDKGAHGEPSPEARKLADSIRRLMTPTPDPRETAPYDFARRLLAEAKLKQAEAERDKERRRAESSADLVDALIGYLNKARDAADAKDWPSLPIAIAALRKRAEPAEIAKKLLERQGEINRLKAAVERAQKWATFTPPKADTCLDAPAEETEAEVERLRKERDALKAATERVRGSLDWLIANGFGAREADLRDLRATLDGQARTTTDNHGHCQGCADSLAKCRADGGRCCDLCQHPTDTTGETDHA